MKIKIKSIFIIICFLIFSCGEYKEDNPFDKNSPNYTKIIASATQKLNFRVEVKWNEIRYPEIAQFWVYRSSSKDSGFKKTGETDSNTYSYEDTVEKREMTYYYYVKAVSKTGSISEPSNTVEIHIDATPPDTIINSHPPGYTNNTNAVFSFSSSEKNTGFECKLDAGGFSSCTSPMSYTGLTEGNHLFYVRAIDAAGNIDPTPASYTWNVDTTPPETTITSTPPANTSSTSASFTFTSSEAGTFECRIDGGSYAPCSSPKNYSGLTEASHTFYVRAIDAAGNIDPTPASYTWAIDTTRPSVPLNLTATNVSCSPIDLSWTPSTDNLTPQNQLIYKIWWSTISPVDTTGPENAVTAPGATNYSVSGLTSGQTYYFKIRSQDLAGNLSGESNESSGRINCLPWAKSYGGTNGDYAYSVEKTADGGIVIGGETSSFGAGGRDLWILKLNNNYDIQWQKAYGGGNAEGWDKIVVKPTSDGGYIGICRTFSFGVAWDDIWVIKINSDGTLAWQKAFGGFSDDVPADVIEAINGGFMILGTTGSFSGGYEIWLIKLNTNGTIAWQKKYGGVSRDTAAQIISTGDGGFIITRETQSFGSGGADLWIIKTDSNGNIIWQKAYGGSGSEEGCSIVETPSGEYVVAGFTSSFGAGNYDFWILKLNPDGTIAWQKTYGGIGDDRAYSIQQTNDNGYVVAGFTNSFGAGNYDFWILKLGSDGSINFNPLSGASTTNTNATVTNTNCAVTNTNATVANTNATVTNTTGTVTNTNAIVNQQAP